MNLIPYISNRLQRAPAHDLADLLGWSFPTQDNGLRFHEDKDNYLVGLDLPGVRKEDLKVDAEGDRLTITAERKLGFGDAKENVSQRRSLTLPSDIDAARISASLVNGVLTLTLPKREETKPRQLKINVS